MHGASCGGHLPAVAWTAEMVVMYVRVCVCVCVCVCVYTCTTVCSWVYSKGLSNSLQHTHNEYTNTQIHYKYTNKHTVWLWSENVPRTALSVMLFNNVKLSHSQLSTLGIVGSISRPNTQGKMHLSCRILIEVVEWWQGVFKWVPQQSALRGTLPVVVRANTRQALGASNCNDEIEQSECQASNCNEIEPPEFEGSNCSNGIKNPELDLKL